MVGSRKALRYAPPRFFSSARSDCSRSSSTLGVIGELHRGGDRVVAGHLRDRAVHRLADAAVGGMSLRRRAQLDDVHRLARVHVHVEPDAIGHGHRVATRRRAARWRPVRRAARRSAPSPRASRRARRLRRSPPVRRSRAAASAAATRASAGDGAADRGTRRSRPARRSDSACARRRGRACGGDSRGRRRRRAAPPRGRRLTSARDQLQQLIVGQVLDAL